jgi:UDP-N-acetylmuramyl pentapeptide phosphotransferase/UDP-N-acetylglucosamine-1-phosphate transferase
LLNIESFSLEFVFLAAISFAICFLLTARLIPFLKAKGMTVLDYHKVAKPQVPRPGGPALVAGIVIGELALFFLSGSYAALGLALVTLVCGLVGLVDDFRTLSGLSKPVILLAGGLPLLILQYAIPNAHVFNPHFYLPLFSVPTNIPLIYPLLVLAAIPVTSNTINTIDVLNGAATGFTLIALIPVGFAIALRIFLVGSSPTTFLILIPVVASTVAFYYFHKYPSKIFPGDSGALALGGAYGALAIVGGVEVVAVIAILPAIMNSFFFLSSVRRLVEHRQIRYQATVTLPDCTMVASKEPKAPVTLLRMITAAKPLGEDQIVKEIFKLVSFTALLAGVTAILTWVIVIGK